MANSIGAYAQGGSNEIGAYEFTPAAAGGGSVWSLAHKGGLACYGGLAGQGGGLAGATNGEDPFTTEQITEVPKRR